MKKIPNIEIKELRALRGPNRYSRHKSIFMVLDIKEYEELPSDKIEGFPERIMKLIPTLYNHGCSIGKPGGFKERLKRGTWAGHIIEHIAIELQCLSGNEVSFGKTYDTLKKGVYIVVFEYEVESVGLKSAKDAVKIFESIVFQKKSNIKQVIASLKILREKDKLGPTTWSIVKEAKSRNIPFIRLNKDSEVQLGYGVHQKKIQGSVTSNTSAIAVEIADEKARSKKYLKESGIPVPYGEIVSNEEEALEVFNKIGAPVVVKPNVGNHGNGITININDIDQLKDAYLIARAKNVQVIVEEFAKGFDYRLLVIGGEFIAAARREPAHVIGDGISSIRALIKKVNTDPRRGFGHEKVLTQIEIDGMLKRFISIKGYSLNTCLKKDEKLYLRATANLSQGATATDVTSEVSYDIRLMAKRIAKIIGLDCVGIDALAMDISLPLNKSGLKVVEVNAAPGFRMHLEPTKGQHRNVAKPLVDMLFPECYEQVPVLAITGTNGKTTTSKLIAHTLKYSGKKVGLACTTGVEIDGYSILSGDYSGPTGANVVLRDSTVDHIVLEVARGGLLRRGLGVSEVDVGVILNIGSDHLGTDWIETQEDLSLIKSTVVEVVKKTGTSVLNADDKIVMNISNRARGNIILFSLNPKNKYLCNHLKNGGTVVTVDNQNVIIRKNNLDIIVCSLEKIPLTFNGIVDFNIANSLAAISALHGLCLPIEQIRGGITTFYPSVNQNPGRMNLFDFHEYKVLVDYGHNPESVRSISKLLPKLSQGRKIALCHGTGSRTNEHIIEFGKELALVYDYIVLADFDPRDRPEGETPMLVREGLIKGGFDKKNIKFVSKSNEALDYLFSRAKTGDLLVIQPDELDPIMSQVLERYRKMSY